MFDIVQGQPYCTECFKAYLTEQVPSESTPVVASELDLSWCNKIVFFIGFLFENKYLKDQIISVDDGTFTLPFFVMTVSDNRQVTKVRWLYNVVL